MARAPIIQHTKRYSGEGHLGLGAVRSNYHLSISINISNFFAKATKLLLFHLNYYEFAKMHQYLHQYLHQYHKIHQYVIVSDCFLLKSKSTFSKPNNKVPNLGRWMLSCTTLLCHALFALASGLPVGLRDSSKPRRQLVHLHLGPAGEDGPLRFLCRYCVQNMRGGQFCRQFATVFASSTSWK